MQVAVLDEVGYERLDVETASRLFADVREWGPNGGPDGVKCDADGNFYLTGVKEDNNPAGPGTKRRSFGSTGRGPA